MCLKLWYWHKMIKKAAKNSSSVAWQPQVFMENCYRVNVFAQARHGYSLDRKIKTSDCSVWWQRMSKNNEKIWFIYSENYWEMWELESESRDFWMWISLLFLDCLKFLFQVFKEEKWGMEKYRHLDKRLHALKWKFCSD